MNQPWLTMRDCPVRAFVLAAAKNSAASATSAAVVNSPSTVSRNMTLRTTSASRSFHNDFSRHLRMQAADVIVGAGVREGEGERVVGVERFRSKSLVLVDHAVRDVIAVDPRHRRPGRNRQLLRAKGEIVDLDFAGPLRRDRSERQRRAEQRTQQDRGNKGTRRRKLLRRESQL